MALSNSSSIRETESETTSMDSSLVDDGCSPEYISFLRNATTHIAPMEAYIFWTILSSITLIGLFGNAFLVAAIVGSPGMRYSAMNVLIMNLACADFGNLFVCFLDWPQILFALGPLWSLPGVLCNVIREAEYIFLYASVFCQVAVAIERFLAIIYPLRIKSLFTARSIHIMSAVIWMLAILFSLPYFYYYQYQPICPGIAFCRAVNEPLTFKVAECSVFYLFPICLIIGLYSRIFHSLNERSLSTELRHTGARSQLRSRRRTIRMLVTCVVIYFTCFSPIQLLLAMKIFGVKLQLPFSVFLSLNALCQASSACNPIIFTLFSDNFRIRFIKIFCGFKHCPLRQYYPHSMMSLNRGRISLPMKIMLTAHSGPNFRRLKNNEIIKYHPAIWM